MSDQDEHENSTTPPVDCNDNDNLCTAAKAGLPKRSSFAFSAVEDAAVDVFRFLLTTITTADAHHWNSALDYAEYHLGEDKGAVLVMRATQLLRALLRQRKQPFSFLTAGCSHICEDELTLMTALRVAQTGLGQPFQNAVNLLARSDEHARLRMQIVQLSDFLHGEGGPVDVRTQTHFPATHSAMLHWFSETQTVQEPDDEAAAAAQSKPQPLRSSDIMGTQREVWIEHGGQLYRLRITSNDKLILTK